MSQSDKVYVQLRRHLDRQAVGFPATWKKSEIKVLKHMFTPQQAEIASHLSHKLEPLETIYPRVKHLVRSPEELSGILDEIHIRGGIECRTNDGKKQYSNLPLVVGMYEYQTERLTPEFVQDFNEYTEQRAFGVAFLSTKLPQMRTIPVGKSIPLQSKVSTFDQVSGLVQRAKPPFVVLSCICRNNKLLQDEPCKVTNRKETCLAFSNMGEASLRFGIGREITRDEVVSILEMNEKDGLVPQPSNTEEAEFICSCCGCCCGILSTHRSLPKPLDFFASNFHSVVDTNACDGCGVCETRCQVGAIKVPPETPIATVDLRRCIGCGLCVTTCKKQAISLHNKPTETTPPKTTEELYDIIMANKKGVLGRWGVTAKILFDAISTRQIHLLKSEKPAPKESKEAVSP
jgi:electron transport complex protein RnfB